MQRQARRDTTPELAVRRQLHAAGLRYRVDHAPVPGLRRRADVVLSRARIAIFIDGCFWHGCREHGAAPKSNSDWWRAKIQRNRDRDADTDRTFTAAGWLVVRVWEHEDPAQAARRVLDLAATRRP